MVSIIIPLYNKAPYLHKALETVCAQTYQDWECIIMDDGSTDGSGELADRLLAELRDERFCLYHQPNAGVSAARNNAVSHSVGEYLCFLDADDWWSPTFLENLLSFAELYPDAGIWACNYIYYKPGKTHVAINNVQSGYINYPRVYYSSSQMPITSISVMMRRSVFLEMGGFPQGIRLGEDFLLWARTAMQYKIAFLDEPLAYYNNDVPAVLRATRNLHNPESHMLFRMDDVERLSKKCDNAADWKLLFDKLRINGLLEYWLDERYHDSAAVELQKVDWSQFPVSARRTYITPIWQLKLKRNVMAVGSSCKQRIIRLLRIK